MAVVIGLIVLNVSGRPTVVSGTTTATHVTTPPPATHTSVPPTTPRTTVPQARPPSQVKLLVANGTNTAGAAGRVSTSLKSAGYNTLAPANSSAPATSSVVYYITGFHAEAASLAATLGLGNSAVVAMPAPPPVASLGAADLLVVVGPDLANRPG
ncbi:MAG: LytR C-terminal domain-containing protein [Acidimicrobiales bacterium]